MIKRRNLRLKAKGVIRIKKIGANPISDADPNLFGFVTRSSGAVSNPDKFLARAGKLSIASAFACSELQFGFDNFTDSIG